MKTTGRTPTPRRGEPGDREGGFLADGGKRLPLAKQLVFTELIEAQPRWLNFMKGNFDFLTLPKDNFQTVVQGRHLSPEMEKKGIRLFFSKEPDITYIAFNNQHPVLKDKRVRKALALAHDTKTSREIFFNGLGVMAQGPIPPDIDGYDPSLKNPMQDFNLKKAKELLGRGRLSRGQGLSHPDL